MICTLKYLISIEREILVIHHDISLWRDVHVFQRAFFRLLVRSFCCNFALEIVTIEKRRTLLLVSHVLKGFLACPILGGTSKRVCVGCIIVHLQTYNP